jgi:DNA-binding NarL/FixJ family response regulator
MASKKSDGDATVVGIVEAQMLFAPFLSQILIDAGFVIGFSREFLERADVEDVQPDVILIDVDFLSADAIGTLRELRELAPDATICSYTGTLDEPWAASCVRAGANCVISKLATPSELVHGILRALRVGSYVDERFDSTASS